MPESRSRAPIVISVVVGIILILAVRSQLGGSSGGGDDHGGGDDIRAGCTVVTVAASPEKSRVLEGIAKSYNGADRKAADTCVQVKVFSSSSGGGMAALARGWDPEVDGGKEKLTPDVWSPASSSWAVLLRQRTAAQDKPDLVPGDNPSDLPSIARTPLVIAMPKPMAEALGWPNKPLGWGDILALTRDPAGWGKFGHPEWGAFRLGKTNPKFSTSGLNATIGTFFAATGVSSDLTAAQIADPKTVAYVKGVEQSVVHYGDTTLTFLQNLQAADDRGQGLSYISAVTIEEKSVWDYNEGNPTGDPETLGKHRKPAVPLVAIYPKEGTLFSDNPYVVLRAPWVDDAKRAGAEDFLKYLQEDRQQRRFVDAAFRDFRGRGGDKINRNNGMLPDQPKLVLSPPAPAVLDVLEKSWDSHRKRARVLEVIDVSGSMGEDVPKAGQTKLELAKKAAIRALEQYAPDDEVGLWIFSTPQPGRSTPWLELVPIAPVSQNLQTLRSRIGALTPVGGTALYATVRESVRFVRRSFDPARINAVVFLTDGKNEYPADTNLQSLIDELEAEDESVAVRVFTIGYGDDADLPTLGRIARASRAKEYDASNPDSIDQVFTNVISNF